MTRKQKITIAVLLVLIGVIARTLPHAWNVAPIAGIALVSGAYLGRTYALVVPLTAMLLGDFIVGTYAPSLMIAVYGSFAVIGLLGTLLRHSRGVLDVLSLSVVASTLFFIITNIAVWATSPWYAHSVHGLLDCFYMALPFFRNTLFGDAVFTGALFSLFAVGYNFNSLMLWTQKTLSLPTSRIDNIR